MQPFKPTTGNARTGAAHLAAVLALLGTASMAYALTFFATLTPRPPQDLTAPPPEIRCAAELRSWVVASSGRHLYLQIDCPDPYDWLDGRVEYTTAAMRRDYRAPQDISQAARVARMMPGILAPPAFAGPPDNRLEAIHSLTIQQAICLQRDRMFSAPYALLGTNSSSGLRKSLQDCGCEVPEHVAAQGGVLGEFPGIDQDPGPEVPPKLWPSFGIPSGPIERTPPENSPTPSEAHT